MLSATANGSSSSTRETPFAIAPSMILWGLVVVFAVYRGRLDPKRSLRLMNERRHDRRGWLYVANEIDTFTREDH
jgi:hypothetical protein